MECPFILHQTPEKGFLSLIFSEARIKFSQSDSWTLNAPPSSNGQTLSISDYGNNSNPVHHDLDISMDNLAENDTNIRERSTI